MQSCYISYLIRQKMAFLVVKLLSVKHSSLKREMFAYKPWYIQVVSLAVYSFFCATLLGRQWLDPDRVDIRQPQVDYVFPFFTVLQFLFYVGWLKVAEALLNPYGEDDEDFDTNWMVDRHLQWSYMVIFFLWNVSKFLSHYHNFWPRTRERS